MQGSCRAGHGVQRRAKECSIPSSFVGTIQLHTHNTYLGTASANDEAISIFLRCSKYRNCSPTLLAGIGPMSRISHDGEPRASCLIWNLSGTNT